MDTLSENILYAVLLAAAIYGAYRIMVAQRILPATLWLACVSALVSIVLYLLGATQVAVIELSVGAGLVTVLLVYAISVTGDDAFDPTSIFPKPLAFGAVLLAAVLLAVMTIPIMKSGQPGQAEPLSVVLWNERVLDVWVQIVLIFSGVMGMLGLLAEGKTRPRSGLDTLHQVLGKDLVGSQNIQPPEEGKFHDDQPA